MKAEPATQACTEDENVASCEHHIDSSSQMLHCCWGLGCAPGSAAPREAACTAEGCPARLVCDMSLLPVAVRLAGGAVTHTLSNDHHVSEAEIQGL